MTVGKTPTRGLALLYAGTAPRYQNTVTYEVGVFDGEQLDGFIHNKAFCFSLYARQGHRTLEDALADTRCKLAKEILAGGRSLKVIRCTFSYTEEAVLHAAPKKQRAVRKRSR